jgi:putative SOS response-associated peptidase YedK
MCNLYSITTNRAAIAGLFRHMNRYVGNLAPMPGVFPDYQAPVIRSTGQAQELVLMRRGMVPPPRTSGPAVSRLDRLARSASKSKRPGSVPVPRKTACAASLRGSCEHQPCFSRPSPSDSDGHSRFDPMIRA